MQPGRPHHNENLTPPGYPLLRFPPVEAAQTAGRFDPGLQRCYKRLAFRKGGARQGGGGAQADGGLLRACPRRVNRGRDARATSTASHRSL